MRQSLNFRCGDAQLVGTLDRPDANDRLARHAGLLIVSGGNEVRSGAHRSMAELAAAIAARGHPVFRFDRRGVGDSEGVNAGFRGSGPDIAAALDRFRAECPQLRRIVAFGNCDAASALALHGTPVDARVFANPWVIAPTDALPPPAAIRARYARRLRDPAAWGALLTGAVDLRKLAKGLGRLAAARPPVPDSLADKVVRAMEASVIPTTIVLAMGDATAIAFNDVWRGDPAVALVKLASASHSFATDAEFTVLMTILVDTLAG